jgi:hypothetical protein
MLRPINWTRVFTPTACTVLLAAFLWLLNHPYVGFSYHDARVYSLLALHWLDPAAYARDPPIFGSLIRWCGLSLASQIVVAIGAVLWVWASWMLARQVFGDWRVRTYVVLSLAIYSFNYSPNSATFLLNENFATARIIAIPLMIMALSFILERRWISGGLLASLSLLIHPLLGIWGVILIAAVRFTDRTLLLLLALIVFALVGMSLSPGPAAFHLMNEEWAQTVRQTSRDVFVGPYGQVRLNATLFWIAALLLGGRFGSPHMRRWYYVMALIASCGFLLAQLCSYFYPIQGVIQAQTWRAMWLAIYLGMFALADVSKAVLSGGRHLRVAAAIGGVVLFVGAEESAALLCFAWIFFRGRLLTNVTATWKAACESFYGRYLGVLAVGLVLTITPTFFRTVAIESHRFVIDWLPYISGLVGVLVFGGLGLGPLILCFAIAQPIVRTVAMLLLIPGTVTVMSSWDHRQPALQEWEKYASRDRGSEITDLPLKRGDVAVWVGNANRVVFEIRTASYASSLQAIGIVFSSEKTTQLARRLRRLAVASVAKSTPIDTLTERQLLARYFSSISSQQGTTASLHDYEPTQLTGPGIRYVCDDLALDWVIAANPVAVSELKPTVVQDDYRHAREYFYRCALIRKFTAR